MMFAWKRVSQVFRLDAHGKEASSSEGLWFGTVGVSVMSAFRVWREWARDSPGQALSSVGTIPIGKKQKKRQFACYRQAGELTSIQFLRDEMKGNSV
jgi:hypothetical protein